MAASAWDLVSKTSPGSSKFRLFILAFVFSIGLLSYGRYYGLPSSNLTATTDQCEDPSNSGQYSNCSADSGGIEPVELTVDDDMESSSSSSSLSSSPSLSSSSTKHIVNGIDIFPPPPPADDEEYMAICRSSRHSIHRNLLTTV